MKDQRSYIRLVSGFLLTGAFFSVCCQGCASKDDAIPVPSTAVTLPVKGGTMSQNPVKAKAPDGTPP